MEYRPYEYRPDHKPKRFSVEEMGAGITVESQPGNGTQITVKWTKDERRTYRSPSGKTEDEGLATERKDV